MDMVIVGSIGYDDIQTPEASGSDLLGGAAVYSGLAASFHLRTMNEEPTGQNSLTYFSTNRYSKSKLDNKVPFNIFESLDNSIIEVFK